MDSRTLGRYLTPEQLLEYLPICPSVAALYKRVARRQIPHVRVGRKLQFDREAIDLWARKRSVGVV